MRCKQAGVGGWVRARSAADGGLVDVDDLVDLFQAGDPFIVAGGQIELLKAADGCPVKGFQHQGGFARPGDTGDAGEHTGWERYIDVFKVVLTRPGNADLTVVSGPSFGRYIDLQPAGKIFAGQ